MTQFSGFVGGETVRYDASGSQTLSYRDDTAGVQFIPGIDLSNSTTKRAVKGASLTLPKFDISMGILEGVNIQFSADASTEHRPSGLCETLIGGFACTFSVATETEAQFGLTVPRLNPDRARPVIIGGVPAYPTGNAWATQTFSSKKRSLAALVPLNPPRTSGPVTIEYNLPSSTFDYYSEPGTFNLTTEILSEATITLDCEIAALAACQGETQVVHEYDYDASVTYRYTPRKIGDFNSDKQVSFADFLVFSEAYGSSANSNPLLDLDGSGAIDFPDFLEFSVAYQAATGSVSVVAVPEPTPFLGVAFCSIGLLAGRRRRLDVANKR